MLHIDIWADFACPACYLAKPRIDQAIAASGHADAITVTYRSFELFPDAGPDPFDSFEHVLHKFGGDQTQAARLEEHMAALARAQGQPYAIHHPVASSFDAHRTLHLAAEHGAASEFMDAVQRDLLGEGVNVYTAAYLANAATRAGVPAARAEALLAGDEYANAVRADKKLAREAGVTAVPFTILGGRLAIPGAATADAYADAITQALTTGDRQ
jgi:predicted DsbA family dithiol-disulfide isomerase